MSSSTKKAIFEAAARLFRDKGYPATSMRDLAKEVNLKASSLYNHIQSKEEILRKICFENALQFNKGISAIETMPITSTEKVVELIRLHIRIAIEDMTSVTVFNDEWRHLSEPYLTDFRSKRRDYENRFLAILEGGIKEGGLKPLDSTIVMLTILSAVRWLYSWYKPGKKTNLQAVENNIISLLMNGLIEE